jgi:ATPase subunit of ABC transporter with duplicated ATPase domains
VLWLSRELATSDTWGSRVVVVVSHDRCFIEDACTDMMHISGVARRLTQTPGRYRCARAGSVVALLRAR